MYNGNCQMTNNKQGLNKMISRIWTKKQTQETIKALRAANLNVEKTSNGYECKINNNLVFKAMIGTNSYLVRYDAKLFE